MKTIDFTHHFPKFLPENTFQQKLSGFLEDWFGAGLEISVQSSGSTGVPKVFTVSKEKMRNSARMTCDFLRLQKGNSALICLPVEYISGKIMVIRSIERQLKLLIATPSIAPLEQLDEKVDFCAMTPLQVENSLDKIHLIKNLIIGGAAVSESLKKKIYEVLLGNSSTENHQPTTIYETYGMTETLSHIALKEIFPNWEEYFTVFEGVGISLDERGCLIISAPNLNPEILKTNDLVEIKNGRQFRFLGRVDNVINSGGAKIFPEELEAIVKKEIPNEAVFLGLPDETLGQKLVLIIEGEVSEAARGQILNIQYRKSFHRPKDIIFIKTIPRLPNGKIDRISIRKNVLNL